MDSAPSLAASRGRSSPTGRRGARSRPPRRRPCPRRRGRGRDGRDRSGSPRPRSAGRAGGPVSAATELTVALKMSFDHCAGRRSRSASTFSPAARIRAAASSTLSYGVSSYGPSHVSVSRMYSTCVSSCRVPLMKVTAEMIGQSPWSRTISSAPRPFSVVIIVASGKWPSSVAAAASRPGSLRREDAEVERRDLGRVAGRPSPTPGRSLRPLIRSPRALSASACSWRRVKHADVRDLCEMPGEEAPDHAAADDAHPLDHPASFL